MGQTQKHSMLARKVIAHIISTYPDKSGDPAFTTQSLSEAIESLKPFQPEQKDLNSINRYLVHYEATDIACKAAWALYKDYVVNGQLKTQSQEHS